MDLRLPTSSKNTRGLKRDRNAVPAATPHRHSAVMVKQARQGNNWKLGRTHKAIHKQLQFNLQVTNINGRSQSLQKHNESLQNYIQCWSIIKNSAVDVSDERAIDDFTIGLRRADLVEEMWQIKPKIVAELMDIASRFADSKDACHNKRT
jgi:hypothetical protein